METRLLRQSSSSFEGGVEGGPTDEHLDKGQAPGPVSFMTWPPLARRQAPDQPSHGEKPS